jgi:hypothetical protein
MLIRLTKDSYKLSTNVTGTIRRNKKFLPQDFGRSMKLAKTNIFAEVHFLLPPVIRKAMSSCASPLHPQQGRRLGTQLCANLPLHKGIMI